MSKPSTEQTLFFQDFFPTSKLGKDRSIEAAEAFFELANAHWVGYSVKDGIEVKVRQNSNCQTHTGGIVWETSYLLACYLTARFSETNHLGKVLEVGSGCGMLGLIVAKSKIAEKVVMTETTDVLENLEQNLRLNNECVKGTEGESGCECCPSDRISVRQLRWDKYRKDIHKCQLNGSSDLDPNSFRTIIGTDVIFCTTLVKPLLKTLREMSYFETEIFLCVQVRCADSHALFLEKAPTYGFSVTERTDDLRDMPCISWGLDLDCKILHLTVEESKKDEKKRKRRKDFKSSKKTKRSRKEKDHT